MEALKSRRSVDLSAYPDLVVVYLGMRVNRWLGVKTLFGIGPGIMAVEKNRPDGLLAHESMMYSLRHLGFRQYWRDLESLETFVRSEPHKTWWKQFSKDRQGAGFWHETYRVKGGMEALYLDMPSIGLGSFAPEKAAEGGFSSLRGRLGA